MVNSVFLLLTGLILLIIGGEFLVRSAVSIAKKFNVPPLLIGVTIVSFGTSAPELMVSLQAALDSSNDIAIGNIVGSNIANIGLVLGLTILLKPIFIDRVKYSFSWWIMLFSSVLFYLFVLDGHLSLLDGLIFVFGLLLFILFSIKYIQNEEQIVNDSSPGLSNHLVVLYFIGGSLGLYFGSELFVTNAVFIADYFGVSQFIIGITVVALGTSLPELVTSLVAIYKNQESISFGNLIGSNIFNVFAVLGITSIVKELKISKEVVNFDLLIMIGFALVLGIIIYGKKISRVKGLLLFTGYLIYIIYKST